MVCLEQYSQPVVIVKGGNPVQIPLYRFSTLNPCPSALYSVAELNVLIDNKIALIPTPVPTPVPTPTPLPTPTPDPNVSGSVQLVLPPSLPVDYVELGLLWSFAVAMVLTCYTIAKPIGIVLSAVRRF
jgi:hypothetical protein